MAHAFGFRPVLRSVVLAGGNCDNGWDCGPRCLNANNVAGDADWNIGASLSYPFKLTEGLP
ncbi:MAG: hypothetical protein RSB55_10385, partial [Oscillospiraceae bacterium]